MIQPEIARRCLRCGAAVRSQARFCPQCGETVSEESSSAATKSGSEAEERARKHETQAEKATLSGDLRLNDEWRRWKESLGESEEKKAFEETPKLERPAPESMSERGGSKPQASKVEDAKVVEKKDEALIDEKAKESKRDAANEKDASERDASERDVRAASSSASPSQQPYGTLFRPPSSAKQRRVESLKESSRARVERVRERSLVVFEEAAENTGFRFVLIALAFFLFFLLLLFLSSQIK